MTWSLEYSSKAEKDLDGLDPYQARLILTWMHRHVSGTDDPRIHGKALSGDRGAQWAYRIGVYRVLVDIQDSKLIVLALRVGHRRHIYRS